MLLFENVTKLVKLAEVGVITNLGDCHQEFKGSYARVKSHLLYISGKGISYKSLLIIFRKCKR